MVCLLSVQFCGSEQGSGQWPNVNWILPCPFQQKCAKCKRTQGLKQEGTKSMSLSVSIKICKEDISSVYIFSGVLALQSVY